MKLKREFVVVSHCILNQHAVIPGWERARGAFPLAISLLNQGVALLQLPCPEFLTLGKERPPMTYQEYVAIPGYRQKCQSMLQPVIQQIKEYQANDYRYLGIIGINESLNCSISAQRGVLMEEYFELCKNHGIVNPYFEVPTWYTEESQGDLYQKLKLFLEGKVNDE